MRIDNEIKLDYKDVLIRPKRSTLGSRAEVNLLRSFSFRNANVDGIAQTYHGIPIMAANMDGVGTFNMALALNKLNLFTCLGKYAAKVPADMIEFFNTPGVYHSVAFSMGISKESLDQLVTLRDYSDLKYVCVDVANGYTEKFVEVIKAVRAISERFVIIAGNVVTGEMTEELILAGADIVKVGIGPGAVCTTRIQTGVGYPQLSAVIECADAAHGLGGHIIADGGCTVPGDVAKAFAGGADFVMLGSMLAGHDEGGGDVITKYYQTSEYVADFGGSEYVNEVKRFVKFYGMSSKAANDAHNGGLKDYRASEGREVLVPYKGPVGNTVQEILGGLRSTCTYAGAKSLKHLSKCTTFVRTTQQFNASLVS